MANIFNQLAGMISFGSYAFYIISILRGKTQPSRSTWWILTIIGALIFSSSYSIGDRQNTWIQLCYVAGPLIIAILSTKYGYGSKKLMPIDKVCIAGSLVCMLLWIIFNSPYVVFAGSILMDFIGLVPTIKKSYQNADSEDLTSWIIETVASMTNLFGIAACFHLSDMSWVYAVYLLTINGSITVMLMRNTSLKYKLS